MTAFLTFYIRHVVLAESFLNSHDHINCSQSQLYVLQLITKLMFVVFFEYCNKKNLLTLSMLQLLFSISICKMLHKNMLKHVAVLMFPA